MPDSNILAFLFSTVAALVATLTGLIGGFATFRLQRMDAKLDFLKDHLLHKKIKGDETLNEQLRSTGYLQIEKIYLHNTAAVSLLKELIKELDYHRHSEEYNHDIENITKHQRLYNKIRKHTFKDYTFSLFFVFISLGMLLFTNALLVSGLLRPVLFLFFLCAAIVFYKFILQVKTLLHNIQMPGYTGQFKQLSAFVFTAYSSSTSYKP